MRVRLVDLARGDARANDVDAGLIGGPVEARHEAEVPAGVPVPRGRPRRRDVAARSGAHGPRRDGGPAGARRHPAPGRPRPSPTGDPTPRPSRGARAGAAAAPGSSTARDGRRSKTWPRSYPRKPTSPPANGGLRGERRRVEPRDEAARHGERVRSCRRGLQDGDRISREVGPPGIPSRPRAFEQADPGQVAERFDDIDRSGGRDPRREAAGSDEGGRRRGGPDVVLGHRRMIRPSARRSAP